MIYSILLCTGCTAICRIDGPYEGKVVDSKTNQPLTGVVVLGVWYKVYPNVAGSTNEFYDSVEMLTDKNGEFKIAGKGLQLLSTLAEMDIVVYKAGYEMLGYGPWSDFKTISGRKFVQWSGDKAIFMLKKLNYEERKKQLLGGPNIAPERQKLLTNEINKERVEFGYNPL